jgi:hypothetical protein
MDEREAQRRGYPLTIPEALLRSEAMQRACAARDFPEVFRLVNRRTGSSYADMAAAVGKMTSARVSDIIRGVRGIRGHGVIERVCDGFGIPGEMLGVPERSWEKGSPPQVDGMATAGTNLTPVRDRKATGQAHAANSTNVIDLLTVAELRQQVQNLDARYATEPSAALVAETGHHLGQLIQWQKYDVPYVVRRDVRAAISEASTLMGQLVWDASGRTDHATARTYFEQASVEARQLGDPVSEGFALLRTSFVALYGEKNPSAGLRLTQQAAVTVKDDSHALGGLAMLHAAEAHAMLQQRQDCERALSSAERHFEHVSSNDAGFSMLSPGQFGRLAGSCFLSLNETARAQRFLESTVIEVREGSKSHAIVLGNLALAYIRQGKADEAVGTLDGAIDIVESHRGGGGLNLIFQAGREVQPWRDLSAVRDLNDRLFSLIATA